MIRRGDPNIQKRMSKLQESYRPVAVFPFAIEAIERVVVAKPMDTYNYSDTQLAFQKTNSTDTAIACCIESRLKVKYTSVLHLNLAYNMVPSDVLVIVVERKPEKNLAKIISLKFIPYKKHLKKYEKFLKQKNIQQGSPEMSNLINFS